MDVTNRVLIIGTSLLWVFVIFVIILLAWGAPDESITRILDLGGYLEDHNNDAAKLIITFGGLIFALLALMIIIIELAPPESGQLTVTKVGSGEARIGTDEIALRVEEELRAVPQLLQAQAVVIGRGSKAEVKLDLHVGAQADLALVAEEACHRAQQLIEGRMGVALTGPPKAELHYRELQVARTEATPTPAAAGVSASPSTAPQAPSGAETSGYTGWDRLPAQPASGGGSPEQPAQSTSGGASPEQPAPSASGGAGPGPFAPPTSSSGSPHDISETPSEDRPAGA
ncbi:MAG: hypothetical protein WEE64_13225 [Dehalococcoidia bacterium]